jgi:hypothetical protein
MSEPFLVRRPSAGVVEAWSQIRLPFEPTGDALRFRTALREALSGLMATGREGLRAEFASTSQDFVDVENVLFYNVGAISFAHADRSVLLFERSGEVPSSPNGSGASPHFHRYEVSVEPSWRHWVEADVAADFGPTPIPALASLTSMAGIWHAVRSGSVGESRAGSGYQLGLTVDISAPREVHLASVMKPLIDGVIAAFHAHDGSDGAELAQRVADSLSLNPGEVRSLLDASERAVLGRRRLLWRRGAGVQWNPGDDLLRAALIRATTHAGTGWSIAGRIVRLDRSTSDGR